MGGYATNPLPIDGNAFGSRGMEDMSRNDALIAAAVGSTISCLIFKLCGSLCSGRSRGPIVGGKGPRANGAPLAFGGGGGGPASTEYGATSAELGSNGA